MVVEILMLVKEDLKLHGDSNDINKENNTNMKKIAFLVSLTFVALSVAAQSITSTSRIVLSHSGQADKEVNMLLSSSFSDAFDNTWDAEAANTGGVYVFYNDKRYTIWASNKYSDNLALGFGTYNDAGNLNYTLKFQNFTGTTEYTLYDRKTATTINVNGSTPDYNFTIDLEDNNNPLITNRFLINYVASDELSACFIGNHLTISNNPYSTGKIVVYDETGAQVGDAYSGLLTDIDLTALTAGKNYTVKFFATADITGAAARTLIIVPVTLP